MSKSAVSQHVRRLEQQSGIQLLYRNTRNVTLTPAGKRLLSRAIILKDQSEFLLQELSVEEASPTGSFSVTFPYFLERDVVTPALKQLCIEFPGLETRLIMTDERLDLIEEGLDVAVYGGDLPDSEYRALPLSKISECFYSSPEYLLHNNNPDRPEDLLHHRWIATDWQNSTANIRNTSTNEYTRLSLKPYVLTNSLGGVISMVEQGMGIGLLPHTLGNRLLLEKKVVQVLQGFEGRKWPFHFVHPFKSGKPKHITRFYQLIKHYFSHFSEK